MLYATATYGLAAMEAADDQKRAIMEPEEPEREPKQFTTKTYASLSKKEETDSTGMSEAFLNKFYRVRTPLEKATRKNISKHIGLEEDDIIAMFVKPGGSMFVLRHFLAVDNKKKAVVLAIRGTFSVTGILIDTQAAGGTLLVKRRKIWSGLRGTDASLTSRLVFDSMSNKSLNSLCYLCRYCHQ
jgi:hypothetical protein